MRLIDRLYQYMHYKGLNAYEIERNCHISNGYLKKQFRGKGGMGSEILEKIYHHYPDLDLVWLITGKGEMLRHPGLPNTVNEVQEPLRHRHQQTVAGLQRQVKLLEALNADKQKLIRLLEKKAGID